jgi:hypothetical protein
MIRKINGQQLRIPSGAAPETAVTPAVAAPFIMTNTCSIQANKLSPGDTLIIRAAIRKTGTSNSFTLRVYWNTTVTTSGATQLALYTISASTLYFQFHRKIHFQSNNVAKIMNTAFNAINDGGDQATTISSVSIANWLSTSGVFFMEIQTGVRATDTIRSLYITVEV